MANISKYNVKAFAWDGTAYSGTLSIWLTSDDRAVHLDQTARHTVGASSTPVTFDAFTIAGVLTIAGLDLDTVAIEGIEYVSPLGPPLALIFVAPGTATVTTLGLLPGDSAFQSLEGPLTVDDLTWSVYAQSAE